MADLDSPEKPSGSDTDSKHLSVAALLATAGIPYTVRSHDGALVVDTDFGPLMLSLTDDEEVLTLLLVLAEMDSRPSKKQLRFGWELLHLNATTKGAACALAAIDDHGPAFVVVRRLFADRLTPEMLDAALTDVCMTAETALNG